MKKLFPILAGIVVFVLALFLMRPEATVPVIVAALDLPEGHTLTAGDIKVRQVSKSEVQPGSFAEAAQLTGKTLRVFRGSGDVILPTQLGEGVISLAANERAVAIHVTDSAGMAGLLRPGDMVGITAVIDSRDGSFSKTVANGLRVLYISPDFNAVQESAMTESADGSLAGSSVSSQRSRQAEGTVVLAVPVNAITIGYDFSGFGVTSESRLVSLTDLLPALDLVANVQLSLFLEPDKAEKFVTSGIFLPNLVITPRPSPSPTPCSGKSCGTTHSTPSVNPTSIP